MKKITLIVAALVIATIGGVYATWNYAGVATDIGIQTNQAITMENAVQNGQAGTYEMTTNLTAINITPNTQEDKIATLKPTMDGDNVVITLKFTPTVNAGDDIEKNALTSYIYFDVERDFKWNGEDIFLFAHDATQAIVINRADSTEEGYKWETTDEIDYFTCTITLNFAELVAIQAGIELPTIDDYNDFIAAIGGSHNIMIHMHLTNIAPNA